MAGEQRRGGVEGREGLNQRGVALLRGVEEPIVSRVGRVRREPEQRDAVAILPEPRLPVFLEIVAGPVAASVPMGFGVVR